MRGILLFLLVFTIGFAVLCPTNGAKAQTPPGPSQAALDAAVRTGTIAALAPLCGLRDEAWAFDLRRAAMMQATGAREPDDPTLATAPGHRLAENALSYAEDEALENFAQAAPAQTCGPLLHDPGLAAGDEMVRAFRALKAGKPSS